MKISDPIIVTYSLVRDIKIEREIAYFGWDSMEP